MTTLQKKNPRNSNLEIYRIILMLLIIAHHYVVNSGLLETAYAQGFTFRSTFLLVLGAWGKIGINCFVLITGYYMCKSHITLQKFLKLLLEIVFYNTCIYLIFALCGYTHFNMTTFLLSSAPIKGISYDFSSCYIVFYLFIPFLNILIKNLNKRQHILLILLCLFTYSLLSYTQIDVIFNYVTWFCVIYILGAFLRLYGIPQIKNTKQWLFLSIITISLCAFSVVIRFHFASGLNCLEVYKDVIDSNRPLAVATAVSLFMYFITRKPFYNRRINTIAASTFGVLLIHANSDIMRWWLWHDTLQNTAAFFSNFIYIHATLSILGIFIICVLIDQVRLRFIEKPFFYKATPLITKAEKAVNSSTSKKI